MKGNASILAALSMAAMMDPMGASLIGGEGLVPSRKWSTGRFKVKSDLTPKQKKARAATKRARKARKINR